MTRRPFLSRLAPVGLLVPIAAILAAAPPDPRPPEPARAPAKTPARTNVYVGTYTDAGSRGIYRFSLDLASGMASSPVLAAESENPSFLAMHPAGRYLYAVLEVDRFQGQATGGLRAFAVARKTGELTPLNDQPSAGTGPCHLSLDRQGRHLLVANYGGGSVASLPIEKDGRLAAAASVRVHQGTGPNPERQKEPHAHGIYLDPRERFALAPDLGADRVFVYGWSGGLLEPHGAGAPLPGSGPRHLAFGRSGRFVYTIDELTSTVTVFRYDAEAGRLERLQTVSTLPQGFTATNSTAEVAVSPDGRFLYGSNRGHDSLAVFAIEPNGQLTQRGQVALGGRTPRHFALDPSGRFLLAALQDSDAIVVFRVDPSSGMPVATGARVSVSRPVCVVFDVR